MDHFSDEWFRSEWRKLGFYYEVDHAAKQWTIMGEGGGLEAFVTAVRLYASDPGNDWISCHCNLGPYDYLEIGTWTSPVIDSHWIAGPLSELMSLADHIQAWLEGAQSGESLLAREFFSPSSPYDLCLHLIGAGFDPSSLDSALTGY